MTQKNICIIGAGIGGLTLAALLLKKGYAVTIFERESALGGRARTLDMKNYDGELIYFYNMRFYR